MKWTFKPVALLYSDEKYVEELDTKKIANIIIVGKKYK